MKLAKAAILTVGDELLNGRVVNTNAVHLAQRLTEIGLLVTATDTVGDDEFAIADAIERLAGLADVLVVAGGLGPTPDDVTREALAGAAGQLLVTKRALKAEIARRTRGRAPKENARMARIPERAEVFPNALGTAAGLRVLVGGVPVYALPGVPLEMEAMFDAAVAPDLEARFGAPSRAPVLLRVFGLAEAVVAQKLGALMARGAEPVVGVTAKDGVLVIAISGVGAAERAAEIRERLGAHVFGEGDATLAGVLMDGMRERGLTLATAESVTGGLLAERCVEVPGASLVFRGGIVAYATELKHELLGVPKALLRREGAVHEDVALKMARGVRQRLGADVGLATTGVAGPDKDAWGNPVGAAYIAVAGPGRKAEAKKLRLTGARTAIRRRIALSALDLARRV